MLFLSSSFNFNCLSFIFCSAPVFAEVLNKAKNIEIFSH